MMTFRARIFLLTALAAVLFLIPAGLGLWAISALRHGQESMLEDGSVIRRHMIADMMHDGLRADVLRHVIELTAEGRAAADQELAEHVELFESSIQANAQASLSAAARTALQAVETPLATYIANAKRLCSISATDPQAALAELPSFQKDFEVLEATIVSSIQNEVP